MRTTDTCFLLNEQNLIDVNLANADNSSWHWTVCCDKPFPQFNDANALFYFLSQLLFSFIILLITIILTYGHLY